MNTLSAESTFAVAANRSNILIVDDVSANLKLLADILKSEDYKVRPVNSGALALQVAEKEKPDLILLDIMMPEMNGYEVCDHLKKNPYLCDIPVIFISALNDTNDIITAFNSGGIDYITKPFRAEEVKIRVATHLKLCRQTKELQKLNEDKNRFISIIGHDLKNPFHLILGFMDLLVKNVRRYDIGKIETQLNIMHQSAQHVYGLMDDILMWSRAQSGTLPFNPTNLSFDNVYAELANILNPRAIAKNITIGKVADDNITLFADKLMLDTVLRNLVSNAIKFTNSGGHIDVCAQQEGDKVVVSVVDNGVGIKPLILEKLFDFSKKISTEGTENEQGTGFGLLLCKEFIEQHGGIIWVETEVGLGSKFIFSLPNQIV